MMNQYEFNEKNLLSSYLIKENLLSRIRSSNKKIIWIWGESGVGKSVFASLLFNHLSGKQHWMSVPNKLEHSEEWILELKTKVDEGNTHLYIDDAQHIQSCLPEFCYWLVDQSSTRLIVVSQKPLDESFSALLAADYILEIPPALLRFTLNETMALCKQQGKEIDAELIRIHQEYEGLPLAIAASLLASKDNNICMPEATFLKAAIWEEEAGNTLLALALYVKAKRLDHFAKLFLGNARHWFASGQRDKIGNVLSLISDAEKDQYPWCWVWDSLMVLPTQPDLSRQHAEHAFQLFRDRQDINGMYLSIAHALLTYLVKLSNFGDIRCLLHELDQFDSDENYNSLDSHAQASASYIIYFCMFLVMPENKNLSKWEERTWSVLVSETEIVPRLKMQVLVQKAYFYTGDSYKIHPLETLKEIGNDKPIEPYDIINFNLARIQEGWCAGKFDEIKSLYKESKQVTAANNMQANISHTSLQVIIALLLNDELEEAKKEIYQLLDAIPREMSALLHHLYAMEAWRLTLTKDYRQAIATAKQCTSISNESGCTVYIGFSFLAEAYTLVLAGEWDFAIQKLDEYHQQKHLDRYQIFGFHIDLLQCVIAFKNKDWKLASEHATRAITFAAKKNLCYFIWSVPEVLALNVSLALSASCETEFCLKLIEARNLPAPPHANSESSWHWPVKIKTLGGFSSNIEGLNKSGKSKRIQLFILYLAIVYQDSGVPLDVLFDTLWPDEDFESARPKLDNALYRLRQILGKQSLLVVNNRVKLDRETTWVDAIYLLDLVKQTKKQLQNGADPTDIKNKVSEMIELYQGEFLHDFQDPSFEIVSYKAYIFNQFRSALDSASKFFEHRNDLIMTERLQTHPIFTQE